MNPDTAHYQVESVTSTKHHHTAELIRLEPTLDEAGEENPHEFLVAGPRTTVVTAEPLAPGDLVEMHISKADPRCTVLG